MAVALNAVTPNPGVVGAEIWSTTTASKLVWNGSAWVALATAAAAALLHLIASNTVLAAGAVQYWTRYAEIAAGVTYEIGADADMEIG